MVPVDKAFGLWAAAAPERALLSGFAEADSLRQRWNGIDGFSVLANAKPVPWDSQYRFTGFNKFLNIDACPAITPPRRHAECHQHKHR